MTGRALPWAVAGLAAAAWLPFLTAPLSPDEGGFLLVASQWRPGPSLYGHYWVDRPPLLITLFDLADTIGHLTGAAVGLRLLGLAWVAASVLLADRLARVATGRRPVVPVVLAGAFLATPLVGTDTVDGELLAVPLVLGGTAALVRAVTTPGRPGLAWATAAGAAAVAAPLVKQNVVDVLVVAAVLLLGELRSHRTGQPRTQSRTRVATLAAAVLVGAGSVLVACLGWAELRGTEPSQLWAAVVTFRLDAASLISTSANPATSERLHQLLRAAALSGAPLVAAVLVSTLRHPRRTPSPTAHEVSRPDLHCPDLHCPDLHCPDLRCPDLRCPDLRCPDLRCPDLRFPALALLAWELVAVVAGGSYWLHYLTGLVPGLVLLAVAAAQRPLPRTAHRAVIAAAAVATTATLATLVTGAATLLTTTTGDAAVAAYLRSHATRHDSVVVGFGHPDIVWDAGLRSPYPQLWSLPVRVLDPRLTELTHVLDGPSAPTWVVVDGSSLATWGVHAATAQHLLQARYRPATTVGSYHVWRLATRRPDDMSRSAARPPVASRAS